MVVAAIEGHVACLFGLVDMLKPEAREVVSELTSMGLEVCVSGETRHASRADVCAAANLCSGSRTTIKPYTAAFNPILLLCDPAFSAKIEQWAPSVHRRRLS